MRIERAMRIERDVLIIGGGIASLALARKLAGGGRSVAVAERASIGEGASAAAAGMLAPLVEARQEEQELVRFGHEALRFYPSFVEELEEETGRQVDYRTEGTLIVASERDHVGMLRHQYEEQRALGLPVEWLSGYECRSLEPYLAPGIPGGIFSAHDHQIDNRLLIAALRGSCVLRSVDLFEHLDDGTLIERSGGWAYEAGELRIAAAEVVMATGARTDLLRERAPAIAHAIRPVKGQIIRLDQSATPLLGHVVRTPEVYLAPKSNGALVVGGTSEDRGFDATVTAGGIFEILRSAWECLPGIYELPIIETRVGFRPATIDHMPMLGSSGIDRLSLAMGYYRHGILFSPLAAEVLSAWLLRGEESEWLSIFSPERFHATPSERAID